MPAELLGSLTQNTGIVNFFNNHFRSRKMMEKYYNYFEQDALQACFFLLY